jgi:two-component system chemotaxis response regulator CheB
LALTILKKMLAASPEIHVVGTARNGREALDVIPRLQPDVICTDFHMPEMDGLELTRQVMGRFPCPILVVSVSVQEDDSHNIFRLLEAGAIDVFPKPRGGMAPGEQGLATEFIRKIKILSGVVPFTKHRTAAQLKASSHEQLYTTEVRALRVVAIGASTGGPQALQTILTPLPRNFPVPILCVQHISEGFLHGLVDWLAAQCRMKVKLAEPGERPLPGTVYFPQEGTHLEIDQTGKLRLSSTPPVGGHRPSVTVTLTSVAQHFGTTAIGILLTGMGGDGAEGLQAISQAGGVTIAQNEESSVVFGMPKQAIALGAARHVLPVHKISPMLLALVMEKRRGVTS